MVIILQMQIIKCYTEKKKLKYDTRTYSSPYAVNWEVGEYNKDLFYFSNEDYKHHHHFRLDWLFEKVAREPDTKDDDLLLILDGDCFPIAPWVDIAKEKLLTHHLFGVKRTENHEEYPHPCFLVMTIGMWKWFIQALDGDPWRNGGGGGPNDYGYYLGQLIKNGKIPWHTLLRSNKNNPHQLFFGVYDNLVYHHGCGYRAPRCYTDRLDKTRKFDDIVDNNIKMDKEWFAKIQTDHLFYKELL